MHTVFVYIWKNARNVLKNVKDTKNRLAQGERIVEVLKQDKNQPVAVEKQVAILYAVVNNILMKVEATDVAEYEAGLYDFLDADPSGIAAMKGIRETGKLEGDTETKLKEALDAYTDKFLKQKGW